MVSLQQTVYNILKNNYGNSLTVNMITEIIIKNKLFKFNSINPKNSVRSACEDLLKKKLIKKGTHNNTHIICIYVYYIYLSPLE